MNVGLTCTAIRVDDRGSCGVSLETWALILAGKGRVRNFDVQQHEIEVLHDVAAVPNDK